MLATLNRVCLLGQIGRLAPALKETPNGAPYASAMLCLTELGTDGKPRTLLVPVEVWGKHAEAATALEPGTLVTLEGRLVRRKGKNDQWELGVMTYEVQRVGAAPGGTHA
jgi:single-stranded DNA-binding protein